MTNSSFLDRFQSKISTVTAQGNFQRSDGVEEIRSGPRRHQTPVKSSRPQRQEVVHQKQPTMVSSPANNYADNQACDSIDQYGGTPQMGMNPYTLAPNIPPQYGYDAHYSYPVNNSQGYAYDAPDKGYVKKSAGTRNGPKKGTEKTQKSTSGFRKMSYQQGSEPELGLDRSAINESKAAAAQGDRLAFSKKGRAVQYQPCTLKEYKKEKPSTYFELGNLQPDLNSDELVAKRANKERVKAFSQSCRQLNKQQSSKKRVEKAEPKKEPSTRDKALEFAKNIPKPKLREPTIHTGKKKKEKVAINQDLGDPSEPALPATNASSKVEALQLKRRSIQAQVDAIRREVSNS